MYCFHCGTPLVEDARFCNRCGKPQPEVPPPSKTGEDRLLKNSADTVSETAEALPVISLVSTPAISDTAVDQVVVAPSLALYNLGYLIAVAGGLLAFLSFFAMPYLNAGYFSLTGQQLAGANLGGQQSAPPYSLLWMEPMVAGAVVLIAGVAAFVKTSSKAASGTVLFLAITTLLILLGRMLYDSQPQTVSNGFGGSFTQPAIVSYYGSGMWVYMFSMVIIVIGTIVQFRAKS